MSISGLIKWFTIRGKKEPRRSVSGSQIALLFFLTFAFLSSGSFAITKEASVISKEATVITKEATREPVEPERPYFKDVSRNHWAASSVNDLVKLGVTQGYPDGTFRGGSKISRYETAVFLAKLATSRQDKTAVNEKILSELRAEVYKLRYQMDMIKKKPDIKRPVYGSFFSRLRLGNLVSSNAATPSINAPLGPVFDYRLIANFRNDFSDFSFIRVGVDTMDSGFSTARDLSREMLEMEAEVNNKSGFGVSVSSGPGLVIHREGPTNIFPSEDYKAYLRPLNSIKFYYEPDSYMAGAGYSATSISSSGAVQINDAFAYAGYKFRGTILGNITFKYTFDEFNNNARATYATAESMINTYDIIVEPTGKFEYNLKVGAKASQNTPHNLFARLGLVSRDLFRQGSNFRLFAAKIGEEFFDYPTYPGLYGLDLFDKIYQNGTYDIAAEISQNVSRGLTLRMGCDVVTGPSGLYGKDEPRSNATFELNLDYGVFEGAVMNIMYRIFQNPSAASNETSDILGLGFKYLF